MTDPCRAESWHYIFLSSRLAMITRIILMSFTSGGIIFPHEANVTFLFLFYFFSFDLPNFSPGAHGHFLHHSDFSTHHFLFPWRYPRSHFLADALIEALGVDA